MTTTATRPSYRGFFTEVADVIDLSQTFRRLVLSGPDLHEFGDAMLDQRIKLILATGRQAGQWPMHDAYAHWRSLADHERPAMRTYTVAGIDHRRRELLVDIACRPVHGPASQFAVDARAGDPLVVLGPDVLSDDAAQDGIAWRPAAARELMIVGDETALPAIRNILRQLPDGASGRVVLEVPTVSDATDLATPPGVELCVVRHCGAPMAAATARLAAVTSVTDQQSLDGARTSDDDDLIWDEVERPTAARYGWLAGEAGGVMALRRSLLAEGHLVRDSASFMGYWKLGRAERAG